MCGEEKPDTDPAEEETRAGDPPSPLDGAVTSDAARTQATRATDSTDSRDVRTGEPGRGPGQIISHYRLEKRLGAGGMGEVWMATDLALGRPTAIKLLRDELSESMRARLRREAKASARLQHPGIATFYDSGEDKGTTWLAMEHVAGETLRQKLRRGPLDVDDTLSLAAGLLEALIHAHAAGVLHRDIKPDNIMLTSGRTAKLLDFGLAKWIGEQGDPTPAGAGAKSMVAEALTAHGAIAGTLGYMSPEQLRGEIVDARTDVFAVGAVIHEMLAGRPAFPGATVRECVDAVLSKPAPPLDLAGAPPGLDEVLQRALSRDASERYAGASALLVDLRRVAEGRVVAELPNTLAVLDLTSLSGERDDWIGVGLAEGLAADLGRVEGLTVVPRERVAAIRGKLAVTEGTVEPVAIGRLMGCRWVLSGSVRRTESNVRITTRLWEAGAGAAVSSEEMDGDLGDVFRLQQRLTAALAERLELTAASTARAPELDAFECYSRGRALLLQFGKEQMKEAGEYYRQAIEIDPDYAPALADLAMLNAMTFSFTTDPRVLDVASDFARRSLTTDPNNGKARAWLGYALWRQGHTRQALSEELRAIELDPTEYTVPYFAACILMEMGRPGEAVAYYQMAIDRFPRWAWAFGCLSWCHLALGNRVEARWSAEHCVELRTNSDALPFPYALAVLAECQRLHGDLNAARQSALLNLEEIERTDHAFRDLVRALGLVVLGRVALSQGDTRAARTAFDQAVEQLRGRPRGMGGGHFMVQALTGQTRAGGGAEPFEEALALFEHRGELDFSWTVTGSSDISLLELAHAATTLGRDSEAGQLLERARRIGLTPVFEERL